MDKTLMHTLKVNYDDRILTFEYYTTKTFKEGLLYYGVLVKSTNLCRHVTGIFPYEQNAKEFADFLFKFKVTPLSLIDNLIEYITQKVGS